MSRHTSIPCLRATLNHVLQDYTATYLAGLGGYRDGSICTKVVAGDCWMSLPAYQRIACALTQHHADTRLSDAMAGPGWRARQDRPGHANASLDDDVAELVRLVGLFQASFRTMPLRILLDLVQKAHEELDDLVAEAMLSYQELPLAA